MMCQQDRISLWPTFVVSIWPVDSLPQLNLSTAQKFWHSSWRASWQFCWILTQDLITFSQSFYDNCIWHSLLCSQWCRFATMSHVLIRRDVPCDGGCRIASPAWATSTGLGRPEDRRSRSGHIGKTRGWQPVVPIKREVFMKYLRYKFCGILRSVYVFFFQNKTINPLKKKNLKKKKKNVVSFLSSEISISRFQKRLAPGFVVVDRLKCDFIII